MPLYDYQCHKCNHTWEVIERSELKITRICRKCSGKARRIISLSGVNCNTEDAEWIRSITEVVNKDPGNKPEDRAFLKHPTRENYRAWMKANNLRHMEPGEGPTKPPPVDERVLTDRLMERHRERMGLEV